MDDKKWNVWTFENIYFVYHYNYSSNSNRINIETAADKAKLMKVITEAFKVTSTKS